MKACAAIALAVLFLAAEANAAHPLITDDTGTQGKDKAQLEFIGETGHDREDGVARTVTVFPTVPVLSYGLADRIDLVLGVPFERIEQKQTGMNTVSRGMSDVSVQMKWKFFERRGLSFAVKPGIMLPTGKENRGLGNGDLSYSAFFIATKKAGGGALHLNVGYIENRFGLQADRDAERTHLWHLSTALELELSQHVKAVANVGADRNPCRNGSADPAFFLAGFIYSMSASLDIDIGFKKGINRPAMDRTYLAGVTWRL